MSPEDCRTAIGRRLIEEGSPAEGVKVLACGSALSLSCSCCGRGREVAQSCRRKWCPVCERVRSADVVDLYRPVIAGMKWPLFLTLTMPHDSTDDIGELLDRLRAGWRKLRRLKWFKDCTAGGVGAIEVSMPEELGDQLGLDDHAGAHPHIHALLDCRWLMVRGQLPQASKGSRAFKRRVREIQAEIAAQWALCLGTETAGVFTRRANPGTVEEVLKYSVSSGALLDSRIPIAPLVAALKGRKGVMPWGTIRKALKAARADKKASEKPLVCECGAEEWRLDPMADRVTNTTTGQWFTPGTDSKGKARGFARFKPWEYP